MKTYMLEWPSGVSRVKKLSLTFWFCAWRLKFGLFISSDGIQDCCDFYLNNNAFSWCFEKFQDSLCVLTAHCLTREMF